MLAAEHFTVDGTLIEAWAGHKSFKRKANVPQPAPGDPRNPSVHFHGEQRRNDTHQSTNDPQARLYKKASGQEAKFCYLGHLLMENRNGLLVNTQLTQASGRAEREAALAMVANLPGWRPLRWVPIRPTTLQRCPRVARPSGHAARRAKTSNRN